MRQKLITLSFLYIFALFGFQCSVNERATVEEFRQETPIPLDLEGIVKRGYLRAIVDNSSTSYYIYKGRRMGYEFELLRNLAADLGVRLHLIVKSDIDEAFHMLNRGKADIIAMNLEVTEQRAEYANFTHPLGQMGTVLVQKKGEQMIRNLADLDDKVIHIREGAVYKAQLCELQTNHNINLAIVEEKGNSEDFVGRVVGGEIPFTVVDRIAGLANTAYHNDLDAHLEVSPKSNIAWAVRKNAPDLQLSVNQWIDKRTKSGYLNTLYAKYFKNSTNHYYRSNSPFSSVAGSVISPYDDIIKKGADNLGWDWRLLASLVYKESRFDTTATSYAGAVGLLQLMPVTLERFGVENPNDPLESLMGGVNYLKYLDRFWKERIPETNERIKVILASYNVGHGHVEDAWKLSIKYGGNPKNWESIARFLALKSDPKYYTDPVVKSGYAKGHLAVNYVDDVMITYDSYRTLIEP